MERARRSERSERVAASGGEGPLGFTTKRRRAQRGATERRHERGRRKRRRRPARYFLQRRRAQRAAGERSSELVGRPAQEGRLLPLLFLVLLGTAAAAQE